MTSLQNKTLIVTGASMGIGRAIALGLAREGVDLVLNARGHEALEEVGTRCTEQGIRVATVQGDISRPEIVARCAQKAEQSRNMFGFIHVAGILNPGPFIWELEPEAFNQVMDTNVKASYLLIRHIVPVILSRGQGVAVFVGSGAAERTQPGIGAYCAAKAAEEMLARQLAAETDRVTSFVFRPGIVDTRMQEQARQAGGGAADLLHRVFRPWKERGELLSPEQSAADLIGLLRKDPGQLHGRTFRAG